jgi:hypothetical protein
MCRVTLWGDCFLLVVFENDRRALNFLGYFFPTENYVLNLTKDGLGYTLGDFFTNSRARFLKKYFIPEHAKPDLS